MQTLSGNGGGARTDAAAVDGRIEGIPRLPFALMRIYAGVMFCGAVIAQLTQHAPAPQPSALVLALEAVAAMALTLGAATRLAALLGMALVARYIMMSHVGLTVLISPGPRTAFMMLLLAVGLGGGGRLLGVDAWLARRWPGLPIW